MASIFGLSWSPSVFKPHWFVSNELQRASAAPWDSNGTWAFKEPAFEAAQKAELVGVAVLPDPPTLYGQAWGLLF